MTSISNQVSRRVSPSFWSGVGMSVERTDRELLECFAGECGEASEEAFAALVGRHGPMVFGVCRNLLGDVHAAEDAFQATFLVLAKKAVGLQQPESLGHWLHGVALRTARKARSLGEAQRRRERQEGGMGGEEPVGDGGRLELRLVQREEAEVLHDEVARLPEHYRAAVVLCYLEGLTHAEAAARLRWPVGTLSVRLMRARKLLHARLSKRGLAPASGLLALLILPETAAAAPPSMLAESTVKTAVRVASGQTLAAGGASVTVAALVDEVLAGLVASTLTPLLWVSALILGLGATGVTMFSTAAKAKADVTATPTQHVAVIPKPKDANAAAKSSAVASEPATEKGRVDGERQSDVDQTAWVPAKVNQPERLQEYRAKVARGGTSADAQVKLALWCEAHGLGAERLKHLALAILNDPTHSVARGLLGQVANGGRWFQADEGAHQGPEGLKNASALAEYLARRGRMENTADAHWRMALWCDRRGLAVESTAHLMAVIRLAPGHEGAWKRLGYQRYHGRWRTESQVAAERDELEAQKKADRYWRLAFTKWRGQLANPKTRLEAELALAEVSDPRAVNSVLAVFGNGETGDQKVAVRLLGQLDTSLSTRTLALFAVGGANSEIQRLACEILARRDHREALGLLIAMLRDPEPNPNTVIYRFQMIPIGALGLGSPGVTFIEGRGGNILRFYTTGETDIFLSPAGQLGFADFSQRVSSPFRVGGETYEHRINRQNGRQLDELNTVLRALILEASAEVEMVRASVRRVNAQVIHTLKNISGVDRDGGWESWTRWWVEERGYSYNPELFRTPADLSIDQAKPTFVSTLRMGYSCFAAGTPIRTANGLRPIESVRVGDQVLVQDTQTGTLSFEPVVAALHNPPDATYRVEVGSESLLATGVHRFWKAGYGWVMARELKEGDTLRVLGGTAQVRRVSLDRKQPVFNLEVAKHQSYFVGKLSALVHDNSPVEPVQHVFDAWTDATEKNDGNAGE